jgi:hypothetical protein
MRVILTPYQAPDANAFAERWIRTVREDCLDHILILNETYLRRVLQEYVESYYNPARPHQGLCQGTPLPREQPVGSGAVQERQVLGGIINDYYRAPVNLHIYQLELFRNCLNILPAILLREICMRISEWRF